MCLSVAYYIEIKNRGRGGKVHALMDLDLEGN